MGKKKCGYIYGAEYASGMFRPKNRSNTKMYSDTKLSIGDYIIVEHEGSGLFVAKIDEDLNNEYTSEDIENFDKSYRYVQKVDLTDFFKEKERQARKMELEEQMRERFAIIDEKKKFEYYATLDDDMKAMYDEYKKLGD